MVNTYSKARDGEVAIASNFRISEFACNDGSDSILLDTRLPGVLQRVRELLCNRPTFVNSGYRTPAWNVKNGGAPDSYHMKGMAADITIGGIEPEQVCRAAETALSEAGIPGGICIYPTFTHIDVRAAPAWRGSNNGSTTVNRGKWTLLSATAASAAGTPSPTETSEGNDKRIWDSLKGRGLNDFAVAGIMGNIFAESAFLPNNLQNSYEKSLKHTDASYTDTVDSGAYTRGAVRQRPRRLRISAVDASRPKRQDV